MYLAARSFRLINVAQTKNNCREKNAFGLQVLPVCINCKLFGKLSIAAW
jgi:hypothetical protein